MWLGSVAKVASMHAHIRRGRVHCKRGRTDAQISFLVSSSFDWVRLMRTMLRPLRASCRQSRSDG